MDSDKNNNEPSSADTGQQAPADALSRTPEDLEQEQAAKKAEEAAAAAAEGKKVSPIKRFFRKVNVYFLGFLLLVIIAGAVTVVNYLNAQKQAPDPTISSQNLTEDSLKQLANTDASVGNTSQTLTIKGNAVIEGQTLMRGNLSVAGTFQTAGDLRAPNITISGSANLGETQTKGLQVDGDLAIQGSTTMRDLNVAGAASFSGAVTASQLTVTNLILSGNATLQVPNHISFTGPTPSRSINPAALGGGGTASISGSDTSGSVNISTGKNTVAGCFVTITFHQPYSKQPRVIISPVGAGAGLTRYYVTRNNTSFSICTSVAAPTNQSFGFDYFVTN